MNDNPLKKYMRTEKLYVSLPSNGHYYDDSIISMTPNKEIGIMPMTAMDEILLNTPDALLNGEGIRKAVESCVPSIKDASKILMPDFDMLLLAIRKASYGDTLTFKVDCPNEKGPEDKPCGHTNEFSASIAAMIDSATKLSYPNFIDLNKEIRVYVRPHSFQCITFISLQSLETGRIMKAIQDDVDNLSDELMEKLKTDYSKSINKLAQINFDTILDGIDYIEIRNEGEIENSEHIKEWLFQLDRKKVEAIRKAIENIEGGVDKEIEVQCENCEHKWKTHVEFNPTDFFDQGS